MSNSLSEIMLASAKASYTVNGRLTQPLPAGYVLDGNFGVGGILAVPDTCFQAIALRNATSGEYIIAFTGTQDGQDWFQNLKLGWDQWDIDDPAASDPKAKILTYLNGLTNATQIHFTGHSLGGALAQYAAYDYIDQFKTDPNFTTIKSSITLTTFNAYGGVQGLSQYRPDGYQPNLITDLVWGSPSADDLDGGADGDWIVGYGGADYIRGVA